MVTLTLFFIGAAPMIAVDSCPHFQIDPLTEKAMLAAFFPKPSIDILLSDTDIWSLKDISHDKISGSNDSHLPSNQNLSSVLTENSDENQLPNNSLPTLNPRNTHFFDKYLLTGSSDILIAKINNSLVHNKSNA